MKNQYQIEIKACCASCQHREAQGNPERRHKDLLDGRPDR